MKSILIFASNTDCGKTLVSTGLVRAAISKGLSCSYIKPIQTGITNSVDSDAMKIKKWTGLNQVQTLFSYIDPVSPHLAAMRENRIVSSFDIREKLAQTINKSNAKLNVVETAGGVLSPFPDEVLAADALQLISSKLEFRTILVGDTRLGGISQTLAALEALEARRYDVCSIVMFSTDEIEASYGNEAFLRKRLILNPPVRRMATPIPKQDEEINKSFFMNPIFDEVLADVLNTDHDRREM